MSAHREVWQTLARLLQKIESSQAATPSEMPAAGLDLTSLEQEVRKLGKAQFKANLLAEEQAARLEKFLAAQAAQEQNARLEERAEKQLVSEAQKKLLEAILPALDGLESALASGRGYLWKRDLAAQKENLTPAQAVLVSPADRAMLAGWLDGLRLVRERLLAILEAGGVTPIPTVGRTFDPYRHVAVGTSEQLPLFGPPVQPGTIVAEERAGYQAAAGVIRYAEVIVYRSKE